VSETIDRFRDWDAAYVLGALSTDDRRAFERHLVTCPECTASLAELAGLPGILSKLSSEDAVAVLASPEDLLAVDDHLRDREHTPGLVQRLAVAAQRRKRRIRLGMLAAAVAVLALFTAGGVALVSSQAPTTAVVAMAPVHQNVITASLQVAKKGWGTSFTWSCSYHDGIWKGTPVSYDLVVVEKSGRSSTVATWSTAGEQASGLTASSAIPTADIRSVEIRLTGTTTPLLRENL
jgi:Putative zinc-finger